MRPNRIIPSFAIGLAISAGVAIVTTTSSAAPVAHSAASLSGAGSSLVAPMVEKVFAPEFQKSTGISVSYSAVGSGAGIEDISKGTVDFGASDAPLDSAQVSGCGGCIEIPWALASTGLSYNLPGVKEVKLSGPVIAEIYLGKITNWNDSKIKALNKGVSLPNETITPVYRSDGSGDTYVFTRYLSEISNEWKTKVGYGTSVSFPAGKGGKGNSGVAAIVGATPGAIGNNSVVLHPRNPPRGGRGPEQRGLLRPPVHRERHLGGKGPAEEGAVAQQPDDEQRGDDRDRSEPDRLSLHAGRRRAIS